MLVITPFARRFKGPPVGRCLHQSSPWQPVHILATIGAVGQGRVVVGGGGVIQHWRVSEQVLKMLVGVQASKR